SVVGTTVATTTNGNGEYAISAPKNASLEFSYVGMQTQTVAVAGRTSIDVKMEADTHKIDDVIVVAYGTAKKESFTGSAGVVSSEDLAKRQVSNISNALTGQVAGLQAVNTTGQPGTSATIRIRGIGSMSASNTPLYVVDGIPYDGSISAINPTDIETMTVLKDAAANAIYGHRGANGVILITTKRGVSKDAVISFDAKWGNNSRAVERYNTIQDPNQYYELLFTSLMNGKTNAGESLANAYKFANENIFVKGAGTGMNIYTVPEGENVFGINGKLNPNATLGYSDADYYYIPDDWYNEIFNAQNIRQEYNLSVSGSSDKINYYMSFGYLDDTGIVSNSGFTRYTARAKTDYQAKKWLKIGANMSYTNYDSQYPGSQTSWGSSGNLFYATGLIAPIYPLYVRSAATKDIMKDNNGITMYDFGSTTNQQRNFMGMSNPAITLYLDKQHAYNDIFNGKWYATVDLFKGMQFTANVGVMASNSRESALTNQFYGGGVGAKGYVTVEHNRSFSVNQQYLLTYKKELGDFGNIDFLAGYETYNLKSQQLGGSNQRLFNPNVAELNNAIFSPATVYSSTGTYATEGLLARLQYDFAGKYFASASFRRDASSRFAPENRWGNFGSIGGAWLMSEEEFLKGSRIFNMLKFKASYGVQGNDNLGNNYAYLDQYNVSNNNGDFAISFAYKGNYDITWEKSHSFNTGFDFSMLGERLNGTVEYFSRITTDLLYNQPVPPSNGYSSYPTNIGSISNTGFEIDLSYLLVNTKNVQWSVNFNATHYTNKILALSDTVDPKTGIVYSMDHYIVGGSLYQSYIKEFAGIDPATGVPNYYRDEVDSEGNVTTSIVTDWSRATQRDLGSTLPKLYGGFGTSLNFFGFDASIMCSYQWGGRVYDFTYQELMHSGDNAGMGWHADILNYWTPENTNTTVHRLDNTDDTYQLLSSRFLTSSDYLSINNITVGYTLPKNITKKIGIGSLRVYVSGDNLGIFAARQGLDPRQDLGGSSYQNVGTGRYSALRTISGGLSLTF
ncbi:MAG: TonB-dependent receptor, partial [Tidjanibacter sp.]|nr:TonB-dependent receptor [Tidjanibacter sp.]